VEWIQYISLLMRYWRGFRGHFCVASYLLSVFISDEWEESEAHPPLPWSFPAMRMKVCLGQGAQRRGHHPGPPPCLLERARLSNCA
jgi:hypothetical protein